MPKTRWPQEAPPADRLRHWPTGIEQVAPGWQALVREFLAGATGQALSRYLRQRLAAGATVYPPQPLRALQLTPPEAVRAVILGQDPYHGPGQAIGLAFAVAAGAKTPPSLRNILQELARDYGRAPRPDGLLEHWAAQGVLLLNTSLTVEHGQPASHARIGWQTLTEAIFRRVAQSERSLAFMLWGAHAQAMKPAGADERHLWLCANHPSPLSARRPPVPFIGCGHFGRAARFVSAADGLPPIDWLGEQA